MISQQEFSHTVLHGDNIMRRAPVAIEAALEHRPQPVDEKCQKVKLNETPIQYNKALAAQARAEAALIAAKREVQEKSQLQQEAKRLELEAKERERARGVRVRERLAKEKLKREQDQLDQEKAKADAALRVEARRQHEQEERIRHQQRQLEWEREKQERRDELQKLRAASEEREKARAEEARKKAQEMREIRMAEKDKNRDRPWRVGNEKGLKEEALEAAIMKDPVELISVDSVDSQVKGAKVQRKPAVARQNIEATPAPHVNELNPHDLVVENALKRRGKQDVDMDAARERREKFERLRMGGDKEDDAARVGGVGGCKKDLLDSPSNISILNEDAIVGAVVVSCDSNEKVRKKKVMANGEWLSDLQGAMGDLKNQMNALKSENSRDSSSASDKASGFPVGDSKQDTPQNVPVYMKKSKLKGNKKKSKLKESPVDILAQIDEEPLQSVEEQRKMKRDKESNDLRRFLKSQRKKQEKVTRGMNNRISLILIIRNS